MGYSDMGSRSFLLLATISLLLFTGCASKPIEDSDSLSLTTARYGHAVVNDGKNIYVIAGSGRRGLLSDIEVIEPSTGKIEVLKGRLIRRRYFSAVWDGDRSIYIIGGISIINRIPRLEKRVEVFDTVTREVRFAKQLPFSTRTNSAVHLGENIFVFGGSYYNKDKLVASPVVAVLNKFSGEWTRAADMPTAKSTRTVARNGMIYAIGGYNEKDSLDVFERFDPVMNTWESLPPIPAKISAHSVSVIKDKIFTFGNYNDLASTYSYDFNTQKWEKVSIGFKASRHNAATTLGDTTYIIGGTTTTEGKVLNYVQPFKL